jgi:hypothetical protein
MCEPISDPQWLKKEVDVIAGYLECDDDANLDPWRKDKIRPCFEADTSFQGRPIRRWSHLADLNHCKQTCDKVSECGYFSFGKGICRLFSRPERRVRAVGIDSGTKWCGKCCPI